jgi:hypothetical protein
MKLLCKRKCFSLLFTLILLQGSFASLLPSVVGQTVDEQAVERPRRPALTLHDGTPVRLKITRTISSKDSKTGDTIDFEVLQEVKVGDLVVIPQNGVALATVTLAKPNGRLGKGGKLDISIDSIRLLSGEKVPLRAVKENKGGNRTGTMTATLVASGILFFPAAPIFLFMKGKNITINKGTEITAYITGDVVLDSAKLAGLQETLTPAPAESMNISVKSAPEGAEIEIDGLFVGSTPSTVPVKTGEHKIVIRKAGHLPWERTLAVAAGSSLTIEAALEKTP